MVKTSSVISEKGETVPTMECTAERSWRIVHDGRVCISLMESEGITETKFTLFTADTMAECVAEGKRVGLSNIDECAAQCTKDQLNESLREVKGADKIDILLKTVVDSGVDISAITTSVSAQVELAKSQTGGGLAKP